MGYTQILGKSNADLTLIIVYGLPAAEYHIILHFLDLSCKGPGSGQRIAAFKGCIVEMESIIGTHGKTCSD